MMQSQREREEAMTDDAGVGAPHFSVDYNIETVVEDRRGPRMTWPISLAIVVVILLLAEIASQRGWVADFLLPAPSDVVVALKDGFASGLYWKHIYSTMSAMMIGFAMASTSAIVIAGILATFDTLERIFLPFIVALQTVPKIAIAPLVIIWLGFGSTGKIVIVAIVSFFPVLVNTMQGLRIRDRDQWELTSALGATKFQLFRYIRVPNAVPYIFAGLHISIIFALIGAVVAEFVGSASGLGHLLMVSKSQFNVPGVFAILLIFMILGLALHLSMKALEQKIAFWATDITVANL